MKKVCLIILLIIGVRFFLDSVPQKKITDFSNPKAIKILQEYILEDIPDYNSKYKNYPLGENTFAAFVDLNNDGIDEVIGYVYCDGGAIGLQKPYEVFYILEKKNEGKYKKITNVGGCYPAKGIEILYLKHNGYHNIKMVYGEFDLHDNVTLYGKFFLRNEDGVYYQYKALEAY